jgi:Holliday junction resolvase
MLSEQKVQTKRIKELEADGYYVIKLIKTNKNGIPDLIAIHPEKGVLFSEVKRANGKLSPLQKYRIEELKKLRFNVEVHYGKTD